MSRTPAPPGPPAYAADAARWAQRHWPLGLALVVAITLRVAQLFPTFFYGDDAEYAQVASYLASDVRNLAYPDMESFGPQPFVSQPPLVLYLFALVGRLVGSMETGPVLVSVLLGTATVGVVYAMGVVLRGPATGGFAALFLAVSPTHVSFSRKAFLDAGLTFFMTLAILCFLVWSQRRTAKWAWATGASAAATVMAKLPGVLVLGPLAAGLAVAGALALWARPRDGPDAKRARLRSYVDDVARMGGVVALAVALYLGFLWYLGSTRDLWVKLAWQFSRVIPGDVAGNIQTERAWHWYFTSSHNSIFHQWGPLIVVLAGVGVLFLAFYAVRRRVAWPAVVVLVLWPVAVLGFFTLSSRKEPFYILPGAPAAALLAGVAVGGLFALGVHLVRRRWGPRVRRAAVAVLLVLAIVLAAVPSASLAQRAVDEQVRVEKRFGYGVKEAALLIHEADPDAAQLGTLLGRFTLHFYNGQTTYHWYISHSFIDDEIREGRIRYAVLDTYLGLDHETAWLEGVVERHNGRLIESYTPPGTSTTRVWLYELRPDA